MNLAESLNTFVFVNFVLPEVFPNPHSNLIVIHLEAHMATDFRKYDPSSETEILFQDSKSLCQFFSKFSCHKDDIGVYSAVHQMPAPA